MRIANDTIYGLNASVFTNDVDRAREVAGRLRSGTVGHNAFRTDFGISFGGFKQSGIGREGGKEGLLPFLETKSVILEGTTRPGTRPKADAMLRDDVQAISVDDHVIEPRARVRRPHRAALPRPRAAHRRAGPGVAGLAVGGPLLPADVPGQRAHPHGSAPAKRARATTSSRATTTT